MVFRGHCQGDYLGQRSGTGRLPAFCRVAAGRGPAAGTLTGRTLVLTGRLPPSLFGLFMQQMRVRPVRRLPMAFGWLTGAGTRRPPAGCGRCARRVGSGDRVMPPEHGRRLAGLLPQGRLAEVADGYTLIPLDQPARLIRDFTG